MFSFYFVFSGYRVLSRKRPSDSPAAIDWAATVMLVEAGVGLSVFGVTRLLSGAGFGTVILVFGGIALGFGGNDIQQFRRGVSDPRVWFYGHLSRMAGGYIATVTAFSSVNFMFLPSVVSWLWPTVFRTPLIFLLVRRYRTQFDRRTAST